MSFKGFFCCLKTNYDVPEVLELDYRHATLTQVPADVFNYERTLEKLVLSSNQLTDLHPQLFHCHELRELEFGDNDIKTIPSGIGNLTKLQRLDASRNVIEEIADNIKLCKDLKYLDLSLNLLTKVPDGIYQLVGLEEINLSDTYLEYLNANFCRLTKLKVLELRENHLQTLPKSMTRFNHLHRLDLGHNEIREMPEVIGTMTNLQELWMDGNSLRRVPSFIGNLHKLSSFDIIGNEVIELADDIGKCTQLVDLSLSFNQIQGLPDTFAKLEQLTVLRLDGNQIQYLPENLGHLKNLQEFTMIKNFLRKLPPSIGLLRKLVLLLLDENLLTELPKEIGSCSSLSVLAVARNRVQCVPSEIGHLSNLKVLNLAGNCIQHLPVSILNIPKLGAIWLTEAQSKPLMPLNKEVDPKTGQTVITCYLLPQILRVDSPVTYESNQEDDSPPLNRTRASVIRFADVNYPEEEEAIEDDGIVEVSASHTAQVISGDVPRPAKTVGLLRAPTPYPKELRALAKHAAQVYAKHQTSNGELYHPPPPAQDLADSTESPMVDAEDPGKSNQVKSPPPYHIAAMSSRRAAFFAGTLGATQDLSAQQSSVPRQPEYIKAMENRLHENQLPTPPPTPKFEIPPPSEPMLNDKVFSTDLSNPKQPLPFEQENIQIAATHRKTSAEFHQAASSLLDSKTLHSNTNNIKSGDKFGGENSELNRPHILYEPKTNDLPDLIHGNGKHTTQFFLTNQSNDNANVELDVIDAAVAVRDDPGNNVEHPLENQNPMILNKLIQDNTEGKTNPPLPNGTTLQTRIPVFRPPGANAKLPKAITMSKITPPSTGFTTPPSGLSRSNSGSRIPRRSSPSPPQQPLLVNNKNEGSQSSSSSLSSQSRIPTLASPPHVGRKPWIFGSHRNARVVSLEHKRPPGSPTRLGFSVRSLNDGGVSVEVVEENYADDDTCLRVGDKILKVDEIDVSKMSLEIVQIILSNCKKSINMLVSRET